MTGSEFVRSVSAWIEASDDVEALADMVTWVRRLQPYFALDPGMTVGQAVRLYLSERATATRRRRAESAASQ